MKILLALLFVATSLFTVPPSMQQKKPPPIKRESRWPILPPKTVWGDIKQIDEKVSLNGPAWTAEGFFFSGKAKRKADFKLVLFWKQCGRDDVGPSLYSWDEVKGEWHGCWGWEYDEVELIIIGDEVMIIGRTLPGVLMAEMDPKP